MNKPRQLKALYVSEVAEILDMDSRWVEAQCRTKKIKAYKLGRYWRISPEHLIEYLESTVPSEERTENWKLIISDLRESVGGAEH